MGMPGLGIVLLLAFGLIAACGPASDPREGDAGSAGDPFTLDIRGSDTMVNLGAALAEAYMVEHSQAELVVQGGGSGTGIAALLNRNADIAQSSRPIRDSELKEAKSQGLEIKEYVVAGDAVVVAVHPQNPLDEISLEDLSRIYRGEITNWSELGGPDKGIVVLSRDTASGTHVFFLETAVRLGGTQGEFGQDVMMVPSTSFIADEVGRNEGAIGYIGLGYLDDRTKALAVVDADGNSTRPDEPHSDGIAYPLARPLFFYLAGEPQGGLAHYMEFVLGPAGQEVVEDLKFLPIK